MGADVLGHEDRIREVAVALVGDGAVDYQWGMGWPDRRALLEHRRQINYYGAREQRLEIAQQIGSGSAHWAVHLFMQGSWSGATIGWWRRSVNRGDARTDSIVHRRRSSRGVPGK